MLRTLFDLVAIIVFSTISCFAQAENLSNVRWQLVEANRKPVTNSTAYFEINEGRKAFVGNSGCNEISGAVAVRTTRIDFTGILSARKSCKPTAGRISDQEFTGALRAATRYRQTGNNLSLSDRRGRTILGFKMLVKPPPPDQSRKIDAASLSDRKWMLEAVNHPRKIIATKGPFVVFDSKKASLSGYTGCNIFNGRLSVTKQEMSVTELNSTERACPDDDKIEVERGFLGGLRNVSRFEIRDGRLFLYENEKLLLTLSADAK